VAAISWALAGVAAAQEAPAPASDTARIQALEAQLRQVSAELRALEAAQKTKAETSAPLPPSEVVTTAAEASPPPPAPPVAQIAPQIAPQTATQTASEPATQAGVVQVQGSAPAEPQYGEPRVALNSSRRLMMQMPGGYSIGLTGDVQIDTGLYDFHADNRAVGPQALSDGVNARRARLGVFGSAPGGWGFALVYDMGNTSDATPKGIETAQIVYGGLKGAAFEIGYSNTFFTLDQSTSSNDTLFMERSASSMVAESFNTGDARTNAGMRFFGDRYWVGAYLTGPASGASHTETAESFGAFERVAVQALKGKDYSLHLGLGVDQLIQASNSGYGTPNSLTLTEEPDLSIDPTELQSTGALGTTAHRVDGGHVYDLETAATWRNLFWQGERYWYEVSRQGLPEADFDGWYGQVSWTLTGETHTYDPQSGAYVRIHPAHPFSLSEGGWGAWEIAARLDEVNLNSNFVPGMALSDNPAAVDGGDQRTTTVGLNWYPNNLIRFLFDYVHTDYDKANDVAVAGAPLGVAVGSSFNAFAFRAQVAF
jgi:phosphate-selective porin OprO and OprP